MVMYDIEMIHEKIYHIFGKIKIPIPPKLKKKYEDEIKFCGLNILPEEVFSTAIFLPLISFLFFFILYLLGLVSISFLFCGLILSFVFFFYFYSYPSFLVKNYRSKAAAEMTLSIIYIGTSLRITGNLENGIVFAAANLSGPLGKDLKRLVTEMQMGRRSIMSVIDELIEKWKVESEEFRDALSLLKSAVGQFESKREEMISTAISLMLDGTKQRMKKYALNLRNPLRILSMFGILLPLLVLVFVPVLIIFLPEMVSTELIIFLYDILLPFAVFIFLSSNLFVKPYSYHQIEAGKIENYKKSKKIVLIVSILVSLVSTLYFSYLLKLEKNFGYMQFLYSLLVVLSIGIPLSLYFLLPSMLNMERNKEIIQIESELPVALFQLSVTSEVGKPIETNLENLLPKINLLKIKALFIKILENIKAFGVSLEEAIKNPKIGVVNLYPSKIVRFSLEMIVEVSKRGMISLSTSLRTFSTFLKDADEVNKACDEILSETTSDLQLMGQIMAPLTAGIVVGLMAIVIYIFSLFGEAISENPLPTTSETGYGFNFVLSFLYNIGKQVPFPIFQIIVGIYLIEITLIISYFLSRLNFGEDEISCDFYIGKMLLISLLIYSIVGSSIYFGISSIMNIETIRGLI